MTKRKVLRYYQKAGCRAIVNDWDNGLIPCISVMTALGKALMAAALADYGVKHKGRVLCLVPTKELCSQNYQEFFEFLSNKQDIGIACRQLGKMQTNKQVVVAMYQSFYSKRACSGAFDYVIIDEAHLVGNNPESQIRKIVTSLLRINPNMRICGMTASPYRLGQGLLTEKCVKGEPLFNSIPYDTSVDPGIARLVEEKHLAQIEVINTHNITVDLSGVKMSGHEFNQTDVGLRFDAICEKSVDDFKQGFIDNEIETALIFVPNCDSGEKVLEQWGDASTMRMTSSRSTAHERARNIDWFVNGSGPRYLVNVNIYTTGFNMPSLQAIVLLRATTSPGLLIQMLGRLIRPYGDLIGKIWDYGSNIERLGGIDDIKIPKTKKRKSDPPRKTCLAIIDETIIFDGLTYHAGQECAYPNLLSAKRCKVCGAEFISEGEEGLYTMRTKAEALAKKAAEMAFTYEVSKVLFDEAISKKSVIKMIKMAFYDEAGNHLANDYLCIEHTGQAKNLATAKIMDMLKNKRDYYQMSKFEGGVNVKSVLFLLGEEYFERFFKQIKTVTVAKEKGFDKVRSWGY